jgi:hypothetical protein
MHPAPKLPMSSMPKPRARLSEAQVIEIFQARASALTATYVSSLYSVSEKAVRDIWKGRTWSRETWHLDTSRPLQLKTAGRPKGCKDKQPRKQRASSHDQLAPSTWSASPMPCRQHPDDDEENALMQCTWPMPRSQQASRWAELSQIAEPTVCVEDSGAWHESSAACPTSPTHRHASVDEQLHEWEAFWRFSSDADPFCCDLKLC